MKTFENCRIYYPSSIADVIFDRPHSIDIDGRLTSIMHMNELNRNSIIRYYTETEPMQIYAKATDTQGRSYTVLVGDVDNPYKSIIAFPDSELNGAFKI